VFRDGIQRPQLPDGQFPQKMSGHPKPHKRNFAQSEDNKISLIRQIALGCRGGLLTGKRNLTASRQRA
jgi:hypothetical protein